MIIYLIGLMGAGKTTVGAALASELGCTFHDTDQLIEQRTGLSVAELFRQKGEAVFREEEARLIRDLKGVHMVVSCGGGLPFYNDLMMLLRQKGTVIYLHASPKVLLQRLPPDDHSRPLLNGALTREETLLRLYVERGAVYRRAHVIIETDNKSISGLISEIQSVLS